MEAEFEQSRITFFSEQVCDRADAALRMAFILTLDRALAHKCVKSAFHSLADSIVDLSPDADITELIVKHCWDSFQKLGVDAAPGSDDLSQILKKFPINDRAALAAVDYMGLTAGAASDALGWAHEDFRSHLASGRQQLLSSSLAGPDS